MLGIEESQSEIVEEYAGLDDWMDRYSLLIDEGNGLAPYPEAWRTPEHVIEGCQSTVWIHCESDGEGRLHYAADSDAIIVKGIVALLLRVVEGQKADDVANATFHFIDDIGLRENLSPTRSNGLLAMIKQVKLYALAYASKARRERATDKE